MIVWGEGDNDGEIHNNQGALYYYTLWSAYLKYIGQLATRQGQASYRRWLRCHSTKLRIGNLRILYWLRFAYIILLEVLSERGSFFIDLTAGVFAISFFQLLWWKNAAKPLCRKASRAYDTTISWRARKSCPIHNLLRQPFHILQNSILFLTIQFPK